MPAANMSAGALGPLAAPRPAPPSRAPARSGARYASGSTGADAGIAARSARPTSESFAYCTRGRFSSAVVPYPKTARIKEEGEWVNRDRNHRQPVAAKLHLCG